MIRNFLNNNRLTIFSLLFAAAIFLSVRFSFAADITWTGAISSDWNTPGNWSSNTIPTSADNITIPDASTTANDPDIANGAVCNNLSIAAGGVLNGNGGIISVYGNWTNNGGFNHGNGTVMFRGSSDTTFLAGNSIYYNLELNKTNNSHTLTVSTIVSAAGDFIHHNGDLRSGQIDLAGNYVIGASADGGCNNSGATATVINFNHPVNDQEVLYNAGGIGTSIRIDKAGGVFIINSDIVINGWAYIQGTVIGLETYSLIFGDDQHGTFLPGSLVYSEIELNKGFGYATLTVSGTAVVAGDFRQTAGDLRSGQIDVYGNYVIGASAKGAANWSGTTPTIINFCHTIDDQQIVCDSGGVGSHIRVDKAGGALVITSNIVINSWTYVQGTVSGLDGYDLIFGDDQSGTFTPGSYVYSNIEVNKSGFYNDLFVYGTALISENLIHTDGDLCSGQFDVEGNYIIGALAKGTDSTNGRVASIVNLNHINNDQQIIYSAGGIGAHIQINKTGGTLTVASDLVVNSWTYIRGNVTGIDVHTLTLGDDQHGVFAQGDLVYKNIELNKASLFDDLLVSSGTLNISGNLTVTDGELKFNTNNTTVNVSGNISIAAVGALNAGTNPITVNGNWTNEGAFSHGNGKVILGGVVNTTFTSGDSQYYDIEINKTAASSSAYVLNISGTATVLRNIIHTDGRIAGGQIDLAGDYVVASAASGGNTVINFNHTSNNQTVLYNAGGAGSRISIDKAGGNFIVSDNIVISGWIYVAGTVLGLDSYTLIFGGGESGVFTPGNLVYSSIQLNKPAASSASDVLTVSDTVMVSGNIIHTDGRFTGGQINLAGDYIVTSAASGGNTTINFNHASNNQTIIYSTGGIGSSIKIDKAGGNFTVSSDITINGWEYAAGTVVGTNSYTIAFSGIVNGSFIPGPLSYKNIEVNKTSASSVLDDLFVGAGALSITGNLTVTDGELKFTPNNPTVTISGNVSIAAAGAISASSNPITVSGNWTNEGTFNHGNGKIIFAGTLNKTFTPGASLYNDIEINKTNHSGIYDNLTISGTATLAGNLIHTEGELISGQIDLISGSYIIPATADGMQSGYAGTIVNLNGTGDQAIDYTAGGVGSHIRVDKAGGTLTISANIVVNSWTYIQGTIVGLDTYRIIFGDDGYGYFNPGSFVYTDIELNKSNNSGNNNDISISGTAIISGDFIQTNGDIINGQIDLYGDYVIASGSDGSGYGHYPNNPTVVNINGTGDQQIDYSTGGLGGSVYVNKISGSLTVPSSLALNGWVYTQGNVIGIDSCTLTLGDDFAGIFTHGGLTYGNVIIAKNNHNGSWDDLTVSSGTLNINGNLYVQEGQLRLDTNNPSLNIGGNLTIGATNTTFTKGTGTITFNGTTPSVFTDSSATPQNVGKLALNKTNPDQTQNTLTLLSNMTCDTLTVNENNTLNLGEGSYTLTLANIGSTANVLTLNGTLSAGDGTIKLTATNSSGNVNLPSASYDHLELTGAETYALTAHTTITGNLSIGETSTLNTNTYNINLSGNFTNSGTFIPNSNTLTLSGNNQSLSGSTTFYNLTKEINSASTLTFASSSTTTVSGTLTLKGQDKDNRLSLYSNVSDSPFLLTLPNEATYDMDYLSVKDSTASRTLTVLNSLDEGGNTNWSISNNTAPVVTVPIVSSNGPLVSVSLNLSDIDQDPLYLKAEYSPDSGSTWLKPYLSSSNASLDNSQTYQLRDISVPSTLSFSWDTLSLQNEGGKIEYSPNLQIRLTPFDGADYGAHQTSSIFIINNRSSVFLPPPKPAVTLPDLISGTLPQGIIQIAISQTPDFKDSIFQEIDYQKLKDIPQTNTTLYLKFRTKEGAVSDALTIHPTSTLLEGDIVKTPHHHDVFIIKYQNGKRYKRLILSPSVFNSYQHLKWENVKTISQDTLDTYTTSSLVQVKGDNNIYELTPEGDTGKRRIYGDITRILKQVQSLPSAWSGDDNSLQDILGSIYEINKVDRDSYILVP